MREWAGRAIPAGFVIKAGVLAQQSMERMETVRSLTLSVAYGGEERRDSVELPIDEGACKRWATQAAKDMAHSILMGLNTPTPTPPQPEG